MNNFGDLLGPWLVRQLAPQPNNARSSAGHSNLVTVGTIMYLARSGATVWGTGTRDTVPRHKYTFDRLDIRAVRGPLTRRALAAIGIDAPEVYGDPGLLTPIALPSLLSLEKRHDIVYVPNYADFASWKNANVSPLINPRAPLEKVLRAIASSHAVVASSLHALILADAFGIPSVRVSSGVEGDFKYHDYALGAGRPLHRVAASPIGAAAALEPAAEVDTRDLLRTFPSDLWQCDKHSK